MYKSQEYKCPKCMMWDDGFPIKNEKIKCSNCNYLGTIDEFKAKSYTFYVQSIIRVIAFDNDDAKKEFESFKKELPYFDEIIKVEEG